MFAQELRQCSINKQAEAHWRHEIMVEYVANKNTHERGFDPKVLLSAR
jgi:hypothetical protein